MREGRKIGLRNFQPISRRISETVIMFITEKTLYSFLSATVQEMTKVMTDYRKSGMRFRLVPKIIDLG